MYSYFCKIFDNEVSLKETLAKSTGGVKHTDRISALGEDPTFECPVYDTKNLILRLQ